jgi:predicted nucleic acid-binding Zn ribbon protein
MKNRPMLRAKSLADVLDELVEKLGIRKKLHEQDVFVVWAETVGERIAQVTTPVRILQGTLFVSVKTGPWRNELSMRKKEIIDRLNGSLSGEIVRDIKFQ